MREEAGIHKHGWQTRTCSKYLKSSKMAIKAAF